MKVAQIIDILYYGGAQTMQVMLARAMRDRADVSLTVISLRDNVHGTHLPAQIEALGTPVVFHSARKLWSPSRFWRLARYVRRERFDVIHTHLPYSNILGTLVGRLLGIPVVASIRNALDDRSGRHYRIRRGLETTLLRYAADRVMAVGYSTAEAHRKRLGGKPIQAVPNAIERIPRLPVEERTRLREELVGNPDRPLLVAVGRLAEQKAYGDLLEAFAEVRRGHPEAALVIAGEGPLEADLSRRIRELGLEGHARLLGSRDDVPRLLAASDLFVSASLWEGMSVALLEAMAAGLPVVATEVSDTPRVVVPGTGALVPPGRPDELAHAMASLLADPERRREFGAAAAAFVEANHGPVAWACQIVSLWESAIGRPPATD